MAAYILYDESRIKTLRDLDRLVPDIHRGIPLLTQYSYPRAIKTHMPYTFRDLARKKDLYKKVVYCVREPLEAIRSYYHFSKATNGLPADCDSLDTFVRCVTDGCYTYGSWQEHVLSWLKAAELNRCEMLLVKYEDLFADPAAQVARVAKFLGKSLTPDQISRVVECTSREAMKTLEKAGSFPGKENMDFVRKQQNRREMAETMADGVLDYLRQQTAEARRRLGYK